MLKNPEKAISARPLQVPDEYVIKDRENANKAQENIENLGKENKKLKADLHRSKSLYKYEYGERSPELERTI